MKREKNPRHPHHRITPAVRKREREKAKSFASSILVCLTCPLNLLEREREREQMQLHLQPLQSNSKVELQYWTHEMSLTSTTFWRKMDKDQWEREREWAIHWPPVTCSDTESQLVPHVTSGSTNVFSYFNVIILPLNFTGPGGGEERENLNNGQVTSNGEDRKERVDDTE